MVDRDRSRTRRRAVVAVARPALGLGHLPGDIVIERGNFRFYFPIVTCLVVSGVVSLILCFLNR